MYAPSEAVVSLARRPGMLLVILVIYPGLIVAALSWFVIDGLLAALATCGAG